MVKYRYTYKIIVHLIARLYAIAKISSTHVTYTILWSVYKLFCVYDRN